MTPEAATGVGEPTATGRASINAGGPAVVAIGGGHGLARTLGAIRRYAGSVTAIVSVADDGGSSGRLRESFQIPAPGDIRRCLLALTPRPSKLADALEYRFDAGELEGHALGNLFLAALTATTGDFVEAVGFVADLLGTVGAVLPAAVAPVQLAATCRGESVVGQAKIMAAGGVTSVRLLPGDVPAPPAALSAIESADQIVIGPGSLYTSVLAALAPVGVSDAVNSSGARCVYVCNLREQIPETSSYDVAGHVAALLAHGIRPDVVVCDTTEIELGEVVAGLDVVTCKLTSKMPSMHDESLLGTVLSSLF